MELPPYRIPMLRSVFNEVYQRARAFLIDAGKIIMAISIVLWILASFPKMENGESVSIHESYAGRIGHAIEPLIEPLGYDWKIGIGLLTSFAAREVMVSTLATIYNVESDRDERIHLSTAIKNDIDLSDYFLDEGVAVVPGEAFGCSNFFRISFATSNEDIIEGCEKIMSACKKLK